MGHWRIPLLFGSIMSSLKTKQNMYLKFLKHYCVKILLAVFVSNIVLFFFSFVGVNVSKSKDLMLGTVKIPLSELINKRTGMLGLK